MVAALLGLLLARDAGVPVADLPLSLGLTVDEEEGGTGSIALARSLRPRHALVMESSGSTSPSPRRAWSRWCSPCSGRSAHGSVPEQGDNAVVKAARLVVALDDLPFLRRSHPLIAPAVVVQQMHGGSDLHVVPDLAEVHLDVRLGPDLRLAGGVRRAERAGRASRRRRAHDRARRRLGDAGRRAVRRAPCDGRSPRRSAATRSSSGSPPGPTPTTWWRWAARRRSCSGRGRGSRRRTGRTITSTCSDVVDCALVRQAPGVGPVARRPRLARGLRAASGQSRRARRDGDLDAGGEQREPQPQIGPGERRGVPAGRSSRTRSPGRGAGRCARAPV